MKPFLPIEPLHYIGQGLAVALGPFHGGVAHEEKAHAAVAFGQSQKAAHAFASGRCTGAPEGTQPVEIPDVYGREEALQVINASRKDYQNNF